MMLKRDGVVHTSTDRQNSKQAWSRKDNFPFAPCKGLLCYRRIEAGNSLCHSVCALGLCYVSGNVKLIIQNAKNMKRAWDVHGTWEKCT